MSCPLRYRANSAIVPMSYRAYYDSSRLREMWLPLLSDSLPGSKQLLMGAFDELDSEAESKVAEESLIASASLSVSCGCLPHLAGGSPSLVLSQAVNLSR